METFYEKLVVLLFKSINHLVKEKRSITRGKQTPTQLAIETNALTVLSIRTFLYIHDFLYVVPQVVIHINIDMTKELQKEIDVSKLTPLLNKYHASA